VKTFMFRVSAVFIIAVGLACSSPVLETETPKVEATSRAFAQNWDNAYFRGTPNSWGTTAMTLVADNTWETVQDFNGQNDPRFKIDRFGDWNQAQPGADYRVSAGVYKITFNDSNNSISVTPANSPGWTAAYFRGTPNDWAATEMTKVEDHIWETTQDFTGQTNPRFKIDRFGDWSENYPAQDYLIADPTIYKITFDDRDQSITLEVPPLDQVATPVIDPSELEILTTDLVGATTSTAGATLRYTINGSDPSNSSAILPEGGINLPAGTVTLKVLATKSGMANSAIAEKTYNVTNPNGSESITVYVKGYSNIYYWATEPAGAVSATAWPGVSLQDDPTGWKKYTFEGVTSTNLIFNGPGQTDDLSRTTGEWWFKDDAWTDFDPDGPVIPVITADPNPGSFNTTQAVSLSSSNPDDTIYYTTNGNIPTTSSAIYSSPITVSSSRVIKAFGVNRDGEAGDIATLNYVVDANLDLTPPTISSNTPAGVYPDPINVSFTIADSQSSVTAYITSDNRDATTADPVYSSGSNRFVAANTRFNLLAVDAAGNQTRESFYFGIGVPERTDFREETIYFLMTTRFYDGDTGNNYYAWDDTMAGNVANGDPAWRGDFKGLVEKLDYIKALGFSAIWVTPVVKNMSGYDYHGYHAVDHSEIDPRYESAGFDFQRLIDEVHARDMKIIQDVVWNHTSNFGEENLRPIFEQDANGDYISWDDPDGLIPTELLETTSAGRGGAYADITPGNQFGARLDTMKEDQYDTEHLYHHEKALSWESYTVQTGQIAGDCVDLNTENPVTTEYLRNAYYQYIDMGVDGFRVDTVKHISRLTFNKEFIPYFKQRGGEDFYIFGEVATRYRQVWNNNIPAISTPFYTWKEEQSYPWGDRLTNKASVEQHWDDNLTVDNEPTTDNHYLRGNSYHTPDWSRRSGMDVIDFPMHWNFANAYDAFGVATGNDHYYSDATWNVTYVDSHDYAPDTAPENQRFALPQDVWAENLSLMYTFRGIPTVYYGSEIEFKKGAPIDVGPNAPLEDTGRAYFGDHITGSVTPTGFGTYTNATGNMAATLAHPLARHIQRLSQIRHAVPALQKGQYSVSDISGGLSFKRRYTDDVTDSFALVTVSGGATFNNIPNGTYVDAVTGDTRNVTNGSLSVGLFGKGNIRVYVLDTAKTPAPGKIGVAGTYIQ
jgi:glycosidase